MGEADVRAAAGRVVAALREAGRSEGTIRRYQAVLDRFAAFLVGRGLSTASDQVCVEFIAGQTGTRLGALREPVADRDVQAVRREPDPARLPQSKPPCMASAWRAELEA
jgi:integrase/recombinase XerD